MIRIRRLVLGAAQSEQVGHRAGAVSDRVRDCWASFFSERPGGIPNAAGLNSTGIDKYLTFASQQFDPAASHLALQKMMHVAVTESDFLFWMHDLNLRVMAPEVKGYVHPQSWWVDFTTISVDG